MPINLLLMLPKLRADAIAAAFFMKFLRGFIVLVRIT